MVRDEYNHSRPVSALIRDWLLYNKAGGGGGILKTVTGNPISISDALAAPIQSLTVSLSPIQEGSGDPSPDNVRPITGRESVTVERTGINLFPNTIWEENPAASKPVTWEVSGDTIKLGKNSATTGIMTAGFNCNLVENQTYTLSVESIVLNASDVVTAKPTLVVFYDDGTNQNLGANWTFAPTKVVKHFRLSIGITNVSWQYATIKGLQLEIGSTASDYEPYDGQTAPIYFGGTGKNLYDPDADGYAKIFLPEGTKLTASANSRVTIEYYDSSKTRIDFWSLNQVSGNRYFRSFTLSQDTYYFRFTTPDADCQLELGLTPTDYDEPAVTVYGGTVDVITGKATIAWKKYIGSAFASASARTGGFYARMNLGVTYAGGQITPALYACNRAVYGGNRYDKWYFYAAGNIGGTVNYVHMYIPADAIDYHEGDNITALLNAAYNASDFEFVLPLAEPFDIDLTPASLSTLKGDNTVWSDGDEVTMTYKAVSS